MSFNVNDLAVMEEPIEDGGSDDGIAEEFLPICKAFVGCDYGRAILVAIGDELEKEISFTAGNYSGTKRQRHIGTKL